MGITASSSSSTPTPPDKALKDDMIDSPALHAAVRAVSAFRNLSRAEVSFLIEASELRTFEPDEILLSQGEPSECAIVLLEGEVTITADSPVSREIEYLSCGHLPAIIRRADGAVEELPAGSLPVGMFDSLKPTVRRTTMRSGDLFFLYTDGVTEATDPAGNQLGEQRLLDLMAEGSEPDSSAWVARVSAAVSEFSQGAPQSDDVTCLALVAA